MPEMNVDEYCYEMRLKKRTEFFNKYECIFSRGNLILYQDIPF